MIAKIAKFACRASEKTKPCVPQIMGYSLTNFISYVYISNPYQKERSDSLQTSAFSLCRNPPVRNSFYQGVPWIKKILESFTSPFHASISLEGLNSCPGSTADDTPVLVFPRTVC